tara:strand:+ start:220 stop:1416 length:1197 start_codon:yes stop_codon:yes gene_type:complete
MCGVRQTMDHIHKNGPKKYMAKKTEDFGVLLQEYFTQIPAVNSLVEGTIISISNGAVRIDINGLIVGIVRGQELFAESPEYANVKVGDKVQATVIEQENENGEMELSFRIAGHQKIWENLAEYLEKEAVIDAKIVHANKGGLMMKVCGIDGFMPVSQLAPNNYPRVPGGDKNRILEQLQKLIGQTLQVKILDIQRNDEKLIVSEKAVWEDAQKSILDKYTIGDIVEGEISALTSFGAFIKFGQNLEGLIHISEIVWQRIDHPKDVLKIGDKVKAQIIDLNKSKIYLSVKRLKDDPWKTVKETYTEGQKVDGTIHKIEPFGLMVKLDDHIHGLAHISEVSNTPVHDLAQLKEMFSIGEIKKFEIITIDPTEHRLGLRVEGVKRAYAQKKVEKKVEKSVE